MWEDSRDIKSAKLRQPVTINPNSNFILLFDFSNSLSISFSQDKISLSKKLYCDLSNLFSVGKNYHIISAQKRAKKTTLTRFYVDKLKCTRYIMQISYLYASDCPARSPNKQKQSQTDPKQFLVSIVLIVLRKAQINRRDQSEELYNLYL